MGRIASFGKLPPAVRDEAERMILYRARSDSEIAAWLQKRGFKISRSAVGRHAKKLRDLLGDLAAFPSLVTGQDAIQLLILTELRAIRALLANKDKP